MRTHVAAGIGAALVMTMAGCGDDSGSESTQSSSGASSSSTSPTYDERHIMSEVRRVDEQLRALGPSTKIPKDADWATDNFRTPYNDEITSTKDSGVVLKGKVTTDSLRLASSDPDAPGGWDVTVHLCTTTTVRAYIDGEDVSTDPADPDKPLPKGPRHNAYTTKYVTPDDGKTWQIDDSRLLTGSDAKEARCDA